MNVPAVKLHARRELVTIVAKCLKNIVRNEASVYNSIMREIKKNPSKTPGEKMWKKPVD